ncbi:hypothetical protein L2985_03685, partial [Streptococcus pneumoniae]|nr:hypothetical protein [Streptococcus pneumoniae]
MDKKLDILDKVKEYLGNKTTQILDNQYKEFLKLNDIRRAFGISEKVLNNSFNFTSKEFNDLINPQLFTPNLKTIQNPCLSLDPGWFLFS